MIGSGATAVTLVPSMAPDAGHVTMLQRTPTYILPQPGTDAWAKWLAPLPVAVSYPIVRWKNALRMVASYQFARKFPVRAQALLRKLTEPQLPAGTSYDEHFLPPYNPWDQRLCVVPDGDFFAALRSGKAEVVTDTIETFTPDRHQSSPRVASSRPTSSSARPG